MSMAGSALNEDSTHLPSARSGERFPQIYKYTKIALSILYSLTAKDMISGITVKDPG
jgi:hypothetical protein